jgi:tetratricopeptide (TPR) repeat protein
MDYGVKIRRKRAITAIMVFVFASALVSVSIPFVAKIKSRFGSERKDILRLWEAGSFDQAFSISGAALESKPMDYFMLTIHGFAAYQLGISQINSSDTLRYIDDSIRSLRKALLFKNAANDGRVHYVLGKAYSYKGDSYADLAIKYLEMAGSLSYTAADIPEYLGLAYAAIGDYRGSVAAFSQALEPPRIEGAIENTEASPQANNPPDMLLLSIARSYSALDELDPARAYLLRCIEVSPDSKIILAARLLLGDILRRMGDISGAEGQYTAILSEAGENAEAHYQLGELYTRQGDTVRARSEWRLAVKTDPSHTKARTRLNM